MATLRNRGVAILGPGTGDQACGETGPGRMLEPAEILAALWPECASSGVLAGRKVLVTAGPTRERIDPVRFITNRSSGKMGYAVAEAARAAGAEVVIVSGPVNVATPPGVQRVDVEAAEQMLEAVNAHLPGAEKIKKTSDSLMLALSRTTDILATVAAGTPRPFVVGFAAETQNVERNALAKLEGKRLDMIAANQVGDNLAFDCEDNALTVYWPGGRRDLARAPKRRLADELVGVIAERFALRGQPVAGDVDGAPAIAPGSAAAR